MSRQLLSLLSLAAVHGFAPARTPFALGRAGVRYAGVGDDEIFAAASACLDEECSVDTARTPASAARRRTPTSRGRDLAARRRAPVDRASADGNTRAGRRVARGAPDPGAGARDDRRRRAARPRRPTRAPSQAKPGRVVDYEHMETLTDVRMMISDLEGLSDPNPFNPFILAIKSAFDVKRKGLYAASPTAEEDYAASR